MALGQKDTDRLYDKAIVPTLGTLGLQPRRIDRINHNDDIDDRILREIKHKGVVAVIADLTYARPSVYFEAGFAARAEVPVVYTARKDHLRPGAADDRRVHFDLQMKNIIDWREKDFTRFKGRLRARLRLVTAPFLAAREAQEASRQVRATFQALSLNERERRLEDAAVREFKRTRFEPLPKANGTYDREFREGWTVVRFKEAGRSLGSLWVTVTLDRNLGRQATERKLLRARFTSGSRARDETPPGTRIASHHLCICGLRRVPSASVDTLFPAFSRMRQRDCLRSVATSPWGYEKTGVRKLYEHVHMLDGLTSLDDFGERFGDVLNFALKPPGRCR